MKKTAFVTGMTGQDGPYLAKYLLENDYRVYGLVQRYSNPNLSNIDYLGIQNDEIPDFADTTMELKQHKRALQ